jgi:hypothetical protein
MPDRPRRAAACFRSHTAGRAPIFIPEPDYFGDDMRTLGATGLALFLAGVAGLGCGSPPPPLPPAEVEGAVTYDGQPVGPGIITFAPLSGGEGGGGIVTDGKYRVVAKAGLHPGKYRVEIRWAKPTGEKREAGYGQSPIVTAEGLPDKYNAESELTAELAEGKNVVNFNLEK